MDAVLVMQPTISNSDENESKYKIKFFPQQLLLLSMNYEHLPEEPFSTAVMYIILQ